MLLVSEPVQELRRESLLRRPRRLVPPAQVAPASERPLEGDCRAPDGHGAGFGRGAAVAGLPERRLQRQAETQAILIPRAAPHTRVASSRSLPETKVVRGTLAATAADCPGPGLAARPAVCAVSYGRDSICACCTCNTLAQLGAMLAIPHSWHAAKRLCDCRALLHSTADATIFCLALSFTRYGSPHLKFLYFSDEELWQLK